MVYLHQHFDRVDLGIGSVVVEKRRREAAEGQEGQHAQGIGQDCIPPGQNRVHFAVGAI